MKKKIVAAVATAAVALSLSGGAVAKKNINKDDLIYMNDVEIKWNKEVLKAREYQKNLIING